MDPERIEPEAVQLLIPSNSDIIPLENSSLVECSICYTKMIKVVGPLDSGTFQFKCEHRFCIECTKEHLSGLINTRQIDKLECP